MKRLHFVTKLIASFLMLVLGTSQAAFADEGALNFAAPDGDVVLSASPRTLIRDGNENSTLTTIKSDLGAEISPSSLFATKSSPGAIAVGAAEGNLTPTGETTPIYFGHIDPGNHVVNRGFCSWNKAASLTVAEADKLCLKALQGQSASTKQKLTALGLDPKKYSYALVNGTDLWNQSNSAGPQFAIKYKKALDQGLKGRRALLDARVEAFRNRVGVLDASGLFNICATQPFYKSRLAGVTPYSETWRWQCIALDQGRRIRQVDKALKLNLGDTSNDSDPIPEAVPSLKHLPDPSEVLTNSSASDSPALNFEPAVEPLSIASAKQTPSAKPKTANNFSAGKSQLEFDSSPQNAAPFSLSIPKSKPSESDSSSLNYDPEEQGSRGAEEQRGTEEQRSTDAKVESWGADLKKTLKSGEKVAGYEVSSPYGMRINPITGIEHFHAGVDLKVPANTPLYALGNPGTSTTLRCWIDPGGGGLVGSMRSPSFPNLQFEALHLSWCKAPTNSSSIQVNAGEVIATTGNTGHSTGPHLHFQVRDQVTGKRIPPAKGFTSWLLTGKEPI